MADVRTAPIDFRIRRWQRLRAEVMRRDDFTCQSCGWRATNVPDDYDGRFTIGWWPHEDDRGLHLDHVVPRHQGGTSSEPNLQVLCESCNCAKGGR